MKVLRFRGGTAFSRFNLVFSYKQSRLSISADTPLSEPAIKESLIKYYSYIESYGRRNPAFLTSLTPLEIDESAPQIVQDMMGSSEITGIGPFSSVAGAIALYVGRDLEQSSGQLVVANGNDYFFKISEDKEMEIPVDASWPQPVVVTVKRKGYPFGLAAAFAPGSFPGTSRGLVLVSGQNSLIADSFATLFSARIKEEKDVDSVLARADDSPLIDGVFVVFGGKIFLWGALSVAGEVKS